MFISQRVGGSKKPSRRYHSNQLIDNYNLFPTEAILKRHYLQCDIDLIYHTVRVTIACHR